jgi:glycerophosphoryl diester phosphodiesterase
MRATGSKPVHPYLDLPLPIVIGHRGSAGTAPENTLESFSAALANGAAILETDAHLTRDGVPVLIHDDDVDRVSDGSGRVTRMTLEELSRLDFGHRFTPDGGATWPRRGRGVRIATLAEALEAFPDARFNIELKEEVEGLVERCVDVVAKAGREEKTLLTAGSDGLMQHLRRHLASTGARIAVGASAADVLAFVRTALDGTPPPAGPMALQIPESFGGRPLVTRELVDHAHAYGIHVHVWTINEPDEMNRLLDLGVDGLVTDFPGRMVEVVSARNAGR